MYLAPFTAYFKLAVQGQSRFERIRYAQKIAADLYTQVAAISGVNLAEPGGGQYSLTNMNNENTFSDLMYGMQFKPQFGNTPAQLVVTGFFEVNTNLVPEYADHQFFLGDRALTGQVGDTLAATIDVPQNGVITEIKSLKSSLDATATTVLSTYTDSDLRVFRVEYKGIIWGDRGLHFPH